LVTAFCARFPGAVPKVSIGDTGEVVSWVLDDTVRVGFVGAEPADHRLKTLPFARDEIILVVSPAHPWAQRGTIELRELAGERVLMREGGSGTLRNVIERLKLEGVALGGGDSPSFGSTQAILTAVEAGFGAAFVSRVAAAAGLTAEKYKEVALADTRLVRDLYITYVEERLDSRLLHQFVAFAETWSA
jgi:DNA-binding transcriptional LysR family regulator